MVTTPTAATTSTPATPFGSFLGSQSIDKFAGGVINSMVASCATSNSRHHTQNVSGRHAHNQNGRLQYAQHSPSSASSSPTGYYYNHMHTADNNSMGYLIASSGNIDHDGTFVSGVPGTATTRVAVSSNSGINGIHVMRVDDNKTAIFAMEDAARAATQCNPKEGSRSSSGNWYVDLYSHGSEVVADFQEQAPTREADTS
jgi:hypothetical protein